MGTQWTVEAGAAVATAATAITAFIWAFIRFSLTRKLTARIALELEPRNVASDGNPPRHIVTLRVRNVGSRRFKPTVALLRPLEQRSSKGGIDSVFAPLHATGRCKKSDDSTDDDSEAQVLNAVRQKEHDQWRGKERGSSALCKLFRAAKHVPSKSQHPQSAEADESSGKPALSDTQRRDIDEACAAVFSVIGAESKLQRMVIDPGETEVFTFVISPNEGKLPVAYSALVHDKRYEWTAPVVLPQ